MRMFLVWVLTAAAVLVQSQSDPKPAPPSLADLGLAYALSSDWVLATSLMRSQAEAEKPSSNSTVLAAVYVPPNKALSFASPFFSLFALHHAQPDCLQFLDAMGRQLAKQDKTEIKNGKQAFSVAGRDFYRTDFEQKAVLSHRSFICTTAKDYILVWNAGARDEKGLEAVVATLDSIKSIKPEGQPPQVGASADALSSEPSGEASSSWKRAQPERVRVSSGVSAGLIVRKVPPIYPTEARAAYIQGTVMLQAEISKEGDVVNLELLSGPIELVGSAVDAVRRWKYRPYLMNGEPVVVDTQIQVNYVLSGR